jgi:hypothetical protein
VKPKTALERGIAGLLTAVLLCCIVCDEEHNLLCENKRNSIKNATEDVRFI